MPEPCWTLPSLSWQGNHSAFQVSVSVSVKRHSTLLFQTFWGIFSTLGGISGPPRVIWVLPGLHPHLALAALEMLAFALWLRQDSFHSRPMHGLRRHLGHLSCIPYPCMSHRLGSETRFLLFTRLRFYLSQVVIIY